MKTLALHTSFALAASLAAQTASATPTQYGMTFLDGVPASINNVGQVVGTTAGGSAFLYDSRSGVTTDLGVHTMARDINDRGDVILQVSAGRDFHPYVYQAGVTTALPMAGCCSTMNPLSINNAGVIMALGVGITGVQGFRYDDFMSAPKYTALWNTKNNNTGQIIGGDGTHAFVGHTGDPVVTYLPFTKATAINDQGQIVGYKNSANDGAIGVLYTEGQLQTILAAPSPLLSSGSNRTSVATAINNLGQVVGHQGIAGWSSMGFLYENGQATYLSSLIDPASGWQIADAYDINDHGAIIGQACKGQGNGLAWLSCTNVLLQPLAAAVPEPQSYALLLAGLGAIGFVARRRRFD